MLHLSSSQPEVLKRFINKVIAVEKMGKEERSAPQEDGDDGSPSSQVGSAPASGGYECQHANNPFTPTCQ